MLRCQRLAGTALALLLRVKLTDPAPDGTFAKRHSLCGLHQRLFMIFGCSLSPLTRFEKTCRCGRLNQITTDGPARQGKRRVSRLAFDALAQLVKTLERAVVIDHRHHKVPMPGNGSAVLHQEVIVKNSGFHHRVAPDAQYKGGLRVRNEHLGQVNAPGTEVFGMRGKAGADLADEQFGQQRRA